ncbi:MAG: CPBP family intramembrane glutamic endopeptidase [Candidatus Pristimantibacillus sp.]
MTYIIAFAILVILPAYNYYRTTTIKLHNSLIEKQKGYYQIYLIYWSLILLIFSQYSFDDLFYSKYPIEFNLLSTIIIGLLIAYLFITTILPLLLIPFHKQFRDMVSSNYDERLYPTTSKQQKMFVLVAITVGICEEVIYRGFLYPFFNQLLLTPFWSFLFASIIFGISHFMQGITGMINSFLFGLIMSYLYIQTGSLFLPIIIHIIYDLKPIWITRLLLLERNKAA